MSIMEIADTKKANTALIGRINNLLNFQETTNTDFGFGEEEE